jgi:hypothetical protein
LALEYLEMTAKISKREVAILIRSFLDGSIGTWDWDDFTSIRQADPEIEAVRQRVIALYDEFPAGKSGGYCNDEGLAELIKIANTLDPISEDEGENDLGL